MSNTTRLIGVLAGGLLLIGTTVVFAQDWPQWRGANRDGKVMGFTAPQTWPTTLTQKWKVTVGDGDATPALVGDKLYVFTRQGDDETTLCLNANDGTQVWKDSYPVQALTPPSVNQHPGPRSSPAVADGKVVTLGARGTVSCLDAASGKVLWRKDEYPNVTPQFFTAMSPSSWMGWRSRIWVEKATAALSPSISPPAMQNGAGPPKARITPHLR